MSKSLEEDIIYYMQKEELNIGESLELIDSLYWADWDLLDSKYPEVIEDIFVFLNKDDFSNEETSKILKLYNNPHGAYISEFASIILNIYKKNKIRFLKSLNLEKDEAINLVYIFRMNDIKIDEDKDFLNAMSSEDLSEEERDTGNNIIKMYKNICNT